MKILQKIFGMGCATAPPASVARTEERPADTFPDLVKKLSDGGWRVRREAAWAIGRISSPQAVPSLISALEGVKHEDLSHVAMLQALGELKDPRAVPCLVAWINRKGRPDGPQGPTPRAAAALALANIPSPAAAAALWQSFSQERSDDHFRASILQALDKLNEPIVEAMDSMLKDRCCPEAVIELAGKRGHASSVAPLVQRIRMGTDIFQASAAATAVADLLSRFISSVDTDSLRAIASLEDRLTIYPERDSGAVGTVNCTGIKRLAQPELERRASAVR